MMRLEMMRVERGVRPLEREEIMMLSSMNLKPTDGWGKLTANQKTADGDWTAGLASLATRRSAVESSNAGKPAKDRVTSLFFASVIRSTFCA